MSLLSASLLVEDSKTGERSSSGAPSDRYSIDIVDLTKKFVKGRHGRGAYTTLKSTFTAFFRKRIAGVSSRILLKEDDNHFALDNLTLRVPKGAAVGIVGRNGSGKSTLLKLISGIYRPDTGHISVNGRIAALIELGAGFHPDFSGRENVYLAGAMYGLSRKEIDKRFNHIVEFAELEHVIDEPVRTYSSGMFMRLGFSLAVHTNPDVLIIDEVLAVGDAAFVVKCEDRIAELKRLGKTLLLVTHDLDAVVRWCDEAIWLDKGVVKERGEPRRVLDAYRYFIEKGEEVGLLARANHIPDYSEPAVVEVDTIDQDLSHERWGSREVEVLDVVIRGAEGKEQAVFHSQDLLTIEIVARANEVVQSLVCGIAIHRNDGVLVLGTNTEIEGIALEPFQEKKTISITVRRLGLNCGSFTLDVAFHAKDGYPFDYHRHIGRFSVRGDQGRHGVVALPLEWQV